MLRNFGKQWLLCVIATWIFGVSTVSAQTIADVEVRSQSGRPVDAESILSFIGQKPGLPYSAKRVNADVRKLEGTGRYSFVATEVRQEGGGIVLVYVVEQRPRIFTITIDGNESLSSKKIIELLELNPRDLVDDAIMAKQLSAVRIAYAKKMYPEVEFEWELAPVPGRSGYVDVAIQVDEGKRTRVAKIKFTGNDEYTDTELKKVMTQKQRGLFSWISKNDRYREENLLNDLREIERRYRMLGYQDVKVADPILERNKSGELIITIPIEKYDRYYIRSIEIKGATMFPVSLLGSQMPISVGRPAASHIIDASRTAVRDYYNQRGFSATRVEVRQRVREEGNLLDLEFVIREGRIARIRDVEIRGNSVTKDHVLRRELTVYPGDVLNDVELRRSVSRMKSLGFMDYANSAVIPTETPGVVDVAFDVKEGSSGNFTAGVGFSSIDDLIGFIEISQGNFDLGDPWGFRGGGEKLKLKLQLGTSRRDMELRYTRPWFMDRKLTLDTALYTHDRQFLSDDYDQQNTGGSIGIRKALTPLWRGAINYKLEEIDVYNVSDSASDLIKMEEGRNTSRGMELSFTRDSRNRPWNPNKGGRILLDAGLTGGIFGFDVDVYNVGIRSSYFYPMIFDHVLNIHGWARVVDFYDDTTYVPLFDRLFLGGPRTVRAFDFRDMGPRDENGEPIGGQSSAYFTVEYTVPVVEQVRIATFYDWGVLNLDAFDFDPSNYNDAFGIGIRIDMPGFPLRFDYAWPITADEFNDEGGRFNFLMGRSW